MGENQPAGISLDGVQKKIDKWLDTQRAKIVDLTDMDVYYIQCDLTHMVVQTEVQLSEILTKAKATPESNVVILGALLHDRVKKKHAVFQSNTLDVESVEWSVIREELAMGYGRVLADANRQTEMLGQLIELGLKLIPFG